MPASFERILVQSKDGRIEPVHTLASEILIKISKRSSWNGLTPTQVLLGMIENPNYWQFEKMIKVGHESLLDRVDAVDKRCSFADLYDENGQYKFAEEAEEAFREEEKNRSKIQKEILNITERVKYLHSGF